MAFEPIYEVSVASGLKKLCSGQVVAEAKLVAAHGEEINKVLGTSAIVDCMIGEVFTGEVRIKGRVDFKVVYLSENGVKCLDYKAEFSDKIESDLLGDGKPCLQAKVLDTDIVSASSSEIKLAAVVEIELFGESKERIKYLSKGGDGIYLSENKLLCTDVVSNFSGKTSLSAEAELGGDIECVESRICVSKATASADMVMVEGEIVSDIVYGGSEVGHISLRTPFGTEIEAKSLSANKVFATARLDDVRASAVENSIVVNYEIEISGFVYEEKELSLICDAFSVEHELNKTMETRTLVVNRDCTYYTDEVSGTVTLASEMPIVDRIVAPIGTNVLISSAYASDGRVTVEGLVRSNVIYYSDETSSYGSVGVEVPFSLVRQMSASEGDEVFACAEALSVTVKIRRGNEIELRTELGLGISLSESKEIRLIGELGEGDAIKPPECAISMHIGGKKETLWDVSRSLCITPDEVMAQNPELSFPLSGGERIICYRKLCK